MKRLVLLAISIVLVNFGCVDVKKMQRVGAGQALVEDNIPFIGDAVRKQRMKEEAEQAGRVEKKRLIKIQQAVASRGYMTIEEFQEVRNCWRNSSIRKQMLVEAIERDLLPLKAMFYVAFKENNYDEAELIRRGWVGFLNETAEFLKKHRYPENVITKTDFQIEKLTSIVGLTDPMLAMLRKEFMIAIEEKNWDDAQKIQNLITARENKLRPKEPQVVYREVPSSGGQTIVQQPSEHTGRHKPRHGAEDWLKGLSMATGKAYTRQDLGKARCIDMLFGF